MTDAEEDLEEEDEEILSSAGRAIDEVLEVLGETILSVDAIDMS